MSTPAGSHQPSPEPTVASTADAIAQFRIIAGAMLRLADALERGGLGAIGSHGPAPRLLPAKEFGRRMGLKVEAVNERCRTGKYPYARMPHNNKRVGYLVPEGYLYGDELPVEQARWFERYWREQKAVTPATEVHGVSGVAQPVPASPQGDTSASQPTSAPASASAAAAQRRAASGADRKREVIGAGTAAEFDLGALDDIVTGPGRAVPPASPDAAGGQQLRGAARRPFGRSRHTKEPV